MRKLENKLSKYAIPNLSLKLIICYMIGYIIYFSKSDWLNYLTLDPFWICKGQVWRLFSWILVPPLNNSMLGILITLFFYYCIGKSLESAWGDYFYNIYLFSGMLFTVLGSFLIFGLLHAFPTLGGMSGILAIDMKYLSLAYISTYYINMSIFLAYAVTFPDAMVLLFFIIPIKVKWLGIIDGIYLLFLFLTGNIFQKIVVVCSVLNFIVFFVLGRKRIGKPRVSRMRSQTRSHVKVRPKNTDNVVPFGISKHKCAICGRTELDNPNLEFRFCSKCNGNYEYCMDHIYTHTHIE